MIKTPNLEIQKPIGDLGKNSFNRVRGQRSAGNDWIGVLVGEWTVD